MKNNLSKDNYETILNYIKSQFEKSNLYQIPKL